MTVIAALVDGERVLMGADRIGTQWDETLIRLGEGKLRHGDGPGDERFVLGCAGIRRASQETLLRWTVPVASTPATFPYDVGASLESHFRGEGGLWDLVTDDEHGTLKCRWLLGWHGRLWMIGCDFTVDELEERFWAIGCAADYAIGAMAALDGLEVAPLDRLGTALDAAARFDVHVAAPFDVVTT